MLNNLTYYLIIINTSYYIKSQVFKIFGSGRVGDEMKLKDCLTNNIRLNYLKPCYNAN